MPIDVEALMNWPFPVQRQTYTEKDTILYALALGYGAQPTDASQLEFVYECDLQAVPTMAATLCHPGFWISDPRTGIDASKVVHGEQHMVFHAPLPVRGTVRGQTRVVDVVDKGKDKGALLTSARQLYDDTSDTLLASIEQRTLCRADGGFSGAGAAAPKAAAAVKPAAAVPAPDHVVDIQTLPQAALLYRLSSDPNPLHVDPAVAQAAGFERPILHGMCTYGIAARAVLTACCDNRGSELVSLTARFSAPVFPGEMIRTEIWDDGVVVRFRCTVPGRGIAVITNGTATTRK
jgi:acyl dehydratase